MSESEATSEAASAAKRLVVRVADLEPFVYPGLAGVYESICLVDDEIVGSRDLNLNHGTLKAGQRLHGGSHPPGSDECYYVLRGRARLALSGDPQTGEGATLHELGPDTVVFIPGGTFHALDNPFDEDLVILTIWPRLPAPGANGIYDERRRAWGASFRYRSTGPSRAQPAAGGEA